MTSDERVGQDRLAGEDLPANGVRPVNPYIAGAPVSGAEMFYGRDDVFEFIRRKLIGQHRDTPIVLKGERRTGKTSVLYQVHRRLDPAYRCVSIDLHGLSLNGIGDLLNGIATFVSNGLRSDYGIDIAPPDRSAFETDPRSAFESVFLTAVLAILGEDHLVLMLDEVVRLDEEVRAGRLEREVFNYLRHLMQHYPRLNFIFSLGSGLEEMQKDYAFLFSAAMYHRISFLEETAARKLIADPVREYFEVSPDAIDTILRVTSGHPYYTQLVCHSLFDRWSSGPPKPTMTAEDVYAVLGEAIELGSPNLTYVWEDSTPEEKAVMSAMATAMRTGPRAVTGRAIRDAWRQADVPLPERKLSAALRSLASREVITGIDSYSFTVDLQRLWLDQHRRLDWVKDELAESIQQWIHDTRNHNTRYFAVLTALVLIAGYFGIGAIVHWPPYTAPISARTSMIDALPAFLQNDLSECKQVKPPASWKIPASDLTWHCTDPADAGETAYVLHFATSDIFNMAWNDFNVWWHFPNHTKYGCPPVGIAQGSLPGQANYSTECGLQTSGANVVTAWVQADPQYNVFWVAQGAVHDRSYTRLFSWVGSKSQSASSPSSAPPTLSAAITPLVKLLPSDITDFETECMSQPASQLPFKAPGLVLALKCSDPGLPNGTVFAFQFDSAHDYVAAWGNFNTWWGFNPSSAGTNCPPSGSSATAQDITGWSSGVYPSHSGQEIECQDVTVNGTSTARSNLEPDYVWSYPTEWAFIDGQGAPGSSFSALQNWWHNT